MKQRYLLLMVILLSTFFNTLIGQSVEELMLRNATLERDLRTSRAIIENLGNQIEDLGIEKEELLIRSNGLIKDLKRASKPSRSYENEFEEAQASNSKLDKENKKLAKSNSRLDRKIRELDSEIARLQRLLKIEIRKVENLEYQKEQLEFQIDEMEVEIDTLEAIKRDLTRTNRKLDRHIDKLQQDSVRKETKIVKQADKIVDLTADKERLLENRTVLRDLAKKQKNQLNEVKDKHKIDKIQLVSSYLGINYNLTAFNNPLVKNKDETLDRGLLPNLSFSWYNSLAGGYFSIPYNYCSNNPFGNCPEDDIDTYFSVRDIESVKMAMDIKGIPYNDLSYSSTENHFKTYNAGIHFAAMRFFYISIGTSILKGSSWDLYEGDLSGFEGIVTEDDVLPVKNNDGFYVLNYESLSIIKPTAGVAFVAPLKILKTNRKANKQIRSKVLSSYNYKSGFQIEVGYDWLFNDFYAKTGLHFKLWNYDQDILDKPEYYNLASNEIRKGLEIVIDEKYNNKREVDNKEINRGLKVVVDALIGRSAYFQSEADDFNIKGEFETAKKTQKKADDLAQLACCLTKTFFEKDNNELPCDRCQKADVELLFEFLPQNKDTGLKEDKETALLKNAKKFFKEAGLYN